MNQVSFQICSSLLDCFFSQKHRNVYSGVFMGNVGDSEVLRRNFGREMLEKLPFSLILAVGVLERTDVLNYFLEIGVDVNRPNGNDSFGPLSQNTS